MATSESWVQDVILCDLCDKPTQQFCNSCQVSLCYECVHGHRDEFQSLSHDIVHFVKRRIQLAFPECTQHKGQRCEAHCKDCHQVACIKCIIAGPHKGHNIEEVGDMYKRMIHEIKEETEEITYEIIPKYRKKKAKIQNTISETQIKFYDLRIQSKNYRQLWHKEVDNMFDKIDSLIQSLKQENMKNLEVYQNKHENLISEMSKTVKQNEKILKSNKFSEVSTYRSRLKEFRGVLKEINLKLPCFVANIVQGEELSIKIEDFKATFNHSPTSTLAFDVSVYHLPTGVGQLLNHAKVAATIHTIYKPLHSLACEGESEVWVTGDSEIISRFKIRGSVKEIVPTKGPDRPQDISVTKEGDLIYSIFVDRTHGMVNIFKTLKTETLIYTPRHWRPVRLCCTRSGDILVYMVHRQFPFNDSRKKIVRYQQCRKTQEIDISFTGKSSSLYLTENNNGDICVSVTNTNTVVVFDRAGEVRFRYDGSSVKTKAPFTPGGIVTDCHSQIIVTDINNDCLHILDENGQFLKCVDNCGLEKPCGLSVDSKGRLWVGLRDLGEIKVVHYLEQA